MASYRQGHRLPAGIAGTIAQNAFPIIKPQKYLWNKETQKGHPMKDLLKIYRRYILTASFISILIFMLNLMLIFLFLLNQFGYKAAKDYQSSRIDALSDQLTLEHGQYVLTEAAEKQIDENLAFAMLINQEGQVIWSRNLPDEIPLSYSLTQVASFTRWYLQDYPVKVYTRPDGLFVTAAPRHSMWKYSLEFQEGFLNAIPSYLLLVLLTNLLLIFTFAILFGQRFYTSLKPLVNGIEQLTEDKALGLAEQGIVGGLAGKLNEASATLIFQRKALEKRDNARTNWIAGVSHDIRTPLSLILGFSDSLAESPHLDDEERKEAVSIRENSLLIKRLIADLNLTSRLEYDSYPLQIKTYTPAALLRSLIASYYNHGLEEEWSLELALDSGLEGITLKGDPDLLLRAFRNLTDNSIRHNPEGCHIQIRGKLKGNSLGLTFSDTGRGIPVQVVKALYRTEAVDKNGSLPHVMGLRIVKQILEAHQGTIEFELLKDVCRSVVIRLPL